MTAAAYNDIIPYGYQRDILAAASPYARNLLAMELGTGKTLTALWLAILQEFDPTRHTMVIVAPDRKSVV